MRRTRLESSMIQRKAKQSRIVIHSLGQNIARKALIWDTAWRQSVTSTRRR